MAVKKSGEDKVLCLTPDDVLSKVIALASDAILVVSQEKNVLYRNAVATQLFEAQELAPLGSELALPVNLTAKNEYMQEVPILLLDGLRLLFNACVFRVMWEGQLAYLVVFKDITEKKATDQLLAHMEARHFVADISDSLSFDKKMVRALKSAFENEEHIALLHLNIDDFKAVNEVFGRAIGDALLDAMYMLLKTKIRKVDHIVRLNADEFVLLLDNLRKTEYAGVVAQNILNALDKPFDLNGQTIYSNVSIGVAAYPDAGENGVALLQHAEIAMKKAKQHGKNQYYFYSDEMGQKNERHLLIKNGLRNALQKHELYMMY